MVQLSPKTTQLVDWTDAAKALGETHVRQVVSDLAERVTEAPGAIPASVVGLAERTRSSCERLSRAMVGELRRRVNVLNTATRHDVEARSKPVSGRAGSVVNAFREVPEGYDGAVRASLRSLRKEMSRCAASIDESLLAVADFGVPRRPSADLD